MMSKLNEALGYRVRLSALFEAPTLGDLAALAEKVGYEQESISAIVPIRKGGAKPALFCVARPNVNALGFVFLSRALSGTFPVYGLQSYMDNDGLLAPFTQQEYEEKAREYIVAMREIQPEGPYFITGFCEGAHIAFEMARQLEAANVEVGMIAILDTWPVENTIDRNRFLIRNYGRVIRSFWRASNRERLDMIHRKLRGTAAVQTKRVTLGKMARDPDYDPENRKVFSKMAEERYWPGKDFKPTVYNGDIVLIKVAYQPFHRIRDKSMGWKIRVKGSVEIVPVLGEHDLLLREPGASSVAQALEVRIDRYLAGKSKAPSTN